MVVKKNNAITRRDFLNGVSIGVGAAAVLSPMELMAGQLSDSSGQINYPPGLTGLRGSHKGSFEVAHSVAWQKKQWPIPSVRTDDTYDLVIVGGGISGLCAAMLFQQEAGKNTRILILDNHDDFGGHAKRNEFNVDGHRLVAYGGSQSIEAPGHYSAVSQKVLRDLAIDTGKFYDYYDENFEKKWGLKPALFFSEKKYGANRITEDPFSWQANGNISVADAVRKFPIPEEARQALLEFLAADNRLTPQAWSKKETLAKLRKTSFTNFLFQHTNVPKVATDIFRDNMKGIWGVGWDSLSTLEAIRLGMLEANRVGLKYADVDPDESEEEPYIFHFPDGNAGVARAMVRRLIPPALAGSAMEDLVINKVDYSELDKPGSPVRLRLNSTAVRVEHATDKKSVEVSYVVGGQVFKVCAGNTILACNNNFLPFLCPEIGVDQAEALQYAAKVPLVYTNVAIRNWQAFAKLGCSGFQIPGAEMHGSMFLDFPVSMGAYKFSANPDMPIVVHATMIPARPDEGLSSREQHRLGRRRLYETSFEDYECDIATQMNGALGSAGFEAERDIAAITVNRWPHGYAYEYNELFDPPGWGPEQGPHIAGRAGWGRISVANADSSAYAYVNGAIDAADRAVREQLKIKS